MKPIANISTEVISNDESQQSELAKVIKFNPFDPLFRANPYPTYHRLRAEEPIHHSFLGGCWMLTRYADVKTVLRSSHVRSGNQPELFKAKSKYLQNQGKNLNALVNASDKLLFNMNPPNHTRLRGLVVKAFSTTVVEKLRPCIQEIIDNLLVKVPDKGSMDIIADIANLLPVNVIARMLGIPNNDIQHQLHHWSNVLSRIVEPVVSLEEYEAINKVMEDFQEYLQSLIAEREKDLQEDLISALITVRDQNNDKLSQDELLTICMLLFVRGVETTVNTIGNGMLALLSYPDQMQKLKNEPALIQSAVNEIVRYDSPVQLIYRVATEDLKICNQTIKAGETILLWLGSANRDPAQFVNPDQLDLNRCNNYHLAFSDGIHHCLGAALARAEAEIAINTLLQRFSDFNLASNKLEWRKNIALRGLKSLPVTFTCS
jgi:pimeloyl-[acyl-carrier protein] synthase